MSGGDVDPVAQHERECAQRSRRRAPPPPPSLRGAGEPSAGGITAASGGTSAVEKDEDEGVRTSIASPQVTPGRMAGTLMLDRPEIQGGRRDPEPSEPGREGRVAPSARPDGPPDYGFRIFDTHPRPSRV